MARIIIKPMVYETEQLMRIHKELHFFAFEKRCQ